MRDNVIEVKDVSIDRDDVYKVVWEDSEIGTITVRKDDLTVLVSHKKGLGPSCRRLLYNIADFLP